MAMFTAYFDESNMTSVFVVSGLVASLNKWESFHRDWNNLLARYQISSMHMKDLAHWRGEFKSWKGDEAKRSELIRRVVEIISRRAMKGVGMAIEHTAFANTIAKDPLVSSLYSDEYTTAGIMSMLLVSKWADKCGITDPIDFVFDVGNKHRTAFQKSYDIARKLPHERHLGSLSFADDRLITPLQASDFVAYETCKICTDFSSGLPRLRKSLKTFLSHVSYDCKVASEDQLIRLISLMKK